MMKAKSEIKVTILVMDRHFLYLPLYLAQFDRPESGKLAFFGKVPPQYSIEIVRPPRQGDRTDSAVFSALMDARLNSSSIMFAACDPTVLLVNQNTDARMAGSLITSSAFWAINHDARDVRLVADLATFDRIICYGPKTTSNLIARRIAKRNTDKLYVVDSTREIEALEKFGEGTLAISPEVLEISNLLHGPLRPGEKRAKVVLELSTSKEFSNVLTTALFTRAEVVEAHPQLVSGVLAALQTALLAIHSNEPIVAECAKHNFKDTFCLDQALALARSGNVFPETIQIRRDRWQRACEFYHVSHAISDGRDKNTLSKSEQLDAEERYNRAVLDPALQKLVSDSITRGFRETANDRDVVSAVGVRRKALIAIWAIGLLVVGFGLGQMFAAPATASAKILMGISWILMLAIGWWSGESAGYAKASRGYAMHWISLVLSWWALHEIVVRRIHPDAHFIVGLSLDDVLAGVMLAVAISWLFGIGIYAYSKSDKKD